MILYGLLLSCLVTLSRSAVPLQVTSHWVGGFNGVFSVHADHAYNGWKAHIVFDKPVESIEIWKADVVSTSDDKKEYIIQGKSWDADLEPGADLEMNFLGTVTGDSPPRGSVFLEGQNPNATFPPMTGNTGQASHGPDVTVTLGPGVTWTAAPESNTAFCDTRAHAKKVDAKMKYDYSKVIGYSILFFEAQRSGKLPDNNRITWRGDSALKDGADVGHDLTGGWYDAGDHVKFGLPMASSVTLLAWGLIQWKDAYVASGQLEYMYDCIKWPLDYFLKAHTAPHELYVQVGDGGPDHAYWGRPEDMTMNRPAFKIDESKPGADAAAETAAAMTAGYLVFKERDPAYATKLLTHAKQLYDFANKFPGIYSNSVNQASGYYRSSHFVDEVAWAACWLYIATNDTQYLTDAETKYPDVITEIPWALSWDDKKIGVEVMLYKLTGKDKYHTDINTALNSWLPGGKWRYTPKGLAYRDRWGPLRYAANGCLIALMLADYGVNPVTYRKWAEKEINYMLGDTGHSYVVGFGVNPPKDPHHRGSSCPSRPTKCDWQQFQASTPNPQTLCGALVGGPDEGDVYTDKRDDYVRNEVACDYNAGFQSAVAGLLHLALKGDLPSEY
ncbi:endoglucanase E-4-like [Liolophura sinensis]|uniref:endoglucanase E-4-like n=1 Tax=Liolophura sinensis TaxID=3198878 RepID=UPI00315879C3